MTTYVSRQIQLKASEQINGREQLISRGDSLTKFNEIAELNEAEFKKYVITLPETDKDLLEGTVITAGKILYLETDTELTLKLDDTADTGITVKPIVDDDTENRRGTLYLEGDFTHVYVTLAGTGDANVIMGVVGA